MSTQQFISKVTTIPSDTDNYAAIEYYDNGLDEQYLLIVGGRSGSSSIRDFEIYSLNNLQWFTGPRLQTARDSHTIRISNDYLYAIGDALTIEKIYIKDIENINNYQWNYLNDTLPNGNDILYFRSVLHNNYIYIMTLDGIHAINTADDTITNGINTMVQPVRNGGAVVVGNILYYFSGYCVSCDNVYDNWQYALLPTLSPTESPSSVPTTITLNPTINPFTAIPTTIKPTIIPSSFDATTFIPTVAPQRFRDGEQVESTENNINIFDKKDKRNDDSMIIVITIVLCVIIILIICITLSFILI
eukprot:132741_1